MTRLIKCDRCGTIFEPRCIRADLLLEVVNIPEGIRNQHDIDLCEGCMRDLFGFLGKDDPYQTSDEGITES